MDSCIGQSLPSFLFFFLLTLTNPTPSLSFQANSYKKAQQSIFPSPCERVRLKKESLLFLFLTKKSSSQRTITERSSHLSYYFKPKATNQTFIQRYKHIIIIIKLQTDHSLY